MFFKRIIFKFGFENEIIAIFGETNTMFSFVVKKLYLSLILLFATFLVEAQITANKTAGCAPLTVNFIPPTGMTTYYWDFDNGGSSEDSNPNVVFSNPKNPYKVSLRACKTCPVLHTIDIAVFTKPSVTIPNTKGCAPLAVNFNPNITLPPGVTATSVKYIFGDGNAKTMTAPTLAPASHTYTVPDQTYPVSFEIKTSPTIAGCDHTIVIPGAVETSSINFNWLNASPNAACNPPLTVGFTHGIVAQKPIVSYEWDFGDGNTSTAVQPSHIYTVAGTYTVTLKVKDENGCEKSRTTSVIIKPNETTKIISLDTICLNRNISLDIDGNSGLQTRWILGSGAVLFGRPVFDNYSTPGWKTVSVTSFYPGNICPKTFTKQIFAIDPKIQHTIVPMPICNKKNTFTLTCTNANQFTDIEWRLHYIRGPLDTPIMTVFGTNFIQPVTHTLNLDTITWQYYKLVLKATATSKYGGCKVELTDTNFINPLIAHVVPTKTLGCRPLKVGFYDKTLRFRKDTLVEWRLLFGDGNETTLTSFNDTFFYTYTNRGDYDMRMIVKNKHGCLDTTYVTKIEVGSAYSADFTITPPVNLCASDPNATITLQSSVNPNLVQQTKFWVDGFKCVQWDNMTFKPNKPGPYPIKMEVVDRGCFSTVTKLITTNGPRSLFKIDQNCDSIKKVNFTNLSTEADSFLWSFGNGQISKDTNPTHYYTKDSIYNVKLIAYHATNGCPPDTFSMPVMIQTPRAVLSKDTYFFCHNDIYKKLSAKGSSGFINDDNNTGFIWEFKDDKAPTRTFDDSLDYNIHERNINSVYLRVRNFMNCVNRDTAIVLVDKIDLSYTIAPDPICSNDTVRYKGTISSLMPIIKQHWTFGDGDSAKKLDTFHVYKFRMRAANVFTNTIKIETSKGCVFQDAKNSLVKKLNLALSSTSQNLCLQSSSIPISLAATTNNLYPCHIQWRNPNATLANGYTNNYNFATTGNFNFGITAIDISNPNCKDTLDPITITVHKKPLLAITSDKDALTVLCDPVNLDLAYTDANATTLISRKWVITDSSGSTTYNNNLTIAKSMRKGLNRVLLTAATQHCTDTTIRNFIVRAPSGTMTIDRNDICKGEEITFTIKNLVDVTDYSIDFGDGTVASNVSSAVHKYNYVPIGGKTVAKAIFTTNGNDCPGKPFDTTIRIHEVFAKFSIDGGADTPICYRSVFIKDSSLGADKYQWNFGDGTNGTMKEPGMKLYPLAEKYVISLFIESKTFGCKDTFIDSLELIPLPKSQTTNDTICLGDTAKIFQTIPQPNIRHLWSPLGIIKNNQWDTVFYKRDSSFQYTATVIDTMTKCQKQSKGNVMVIRPMPSQKLDTTVSPGADVTLPFTPIANYRLNWTTDSFLSCTDCKDPLAKYLLNPITYKVIFYDEIKNCFRDSSIYKINIFPDILVNAPTAFTPNGDGNNDIFYARGFGIKKLASFKIYNRQGTLIFFSQSEDVGWDGYYKGDPQNSDTYFYTIEGESYIPNKRVFKEGNFMLLR